MTAHPIDAEALRRLADAATPGPWEFTGRDDSTTWIEAPTGDVLIHDERGSGHMRENFSWIKKPDAEFIAAARTAVPALLDALAAAEHRATRAEARADIRKRQVAYWRAETQKTRDRLRALSTDL